VKLSDFGIAVTAAGWHEPVRHGRARIRGTAGYMAPEQARNGVVDARSDLYSLAVTLYEALSGERLFVGEFGASLGATLPIPPLSLRRPDAPSSIDAALRKALAPDPDDRFRTATDFSCALRQVSRVERFDWTVHDLSAHLHEVAGPPACWRDHAVAGVATSTATATVPGQGDTAIDDPWDAEGPVLRW
jgi:serine/threonine protein kinase